MFIQSTHSEHVDYMTSYAFGYFGPTAGYAFGPSTCIVEDHLYPQFQGRWIFDLGMGD